MNKLEKDLLVTLEDKIYKLYEPSHINNERSSNKVDSLHYLVHRHLSLILLPSKYKIWSKYTDKSEYIANGKYFNKKTDLAIIDISNNKVVATIEFKFWVSSIQKNLTNSFSNMLGEALNIQKAGIKTFWILCLNEVSPIFTTEKLIKGFYTFKEKELDKFKIAYQNKNDNSFEIPKGLAINIYSDNLELKGFKEKRDIGIALDKMQKDKSLKLEFAKKYEYNKNDLFINKYSEFIEYVCREVQND